MLVISDLSYFTVISDLSDFTVISDLSDFTVISASGASLYEKHI